MQLLRSFAIVILAGALLGQALTSVRNEQPLPKPDGVTQFFTLKHKPATIYSVALYRNGIRLFPGVDYSIVPNTNRIGFLACCLPQLGDLLIADYDFAP